MPETSPNLDRSTVSRYSITRYIFKSTFRKQIIIPSRNAKSKHRSASKSANKKKPYRLALHRIRMPGQIQFQIKLQTTLFQTAHSTKYYFKLHRNRTACLKRTLRNRVLSTCTKDIPRNPSLESDYRI